MASAQRLRFSMSVAVIAVRRVPVQRTPLRNSVAEASAAITNQPRFLNAAHDRSAYGPG